METEVKGTSRPSHRTYATGDLVGKYLLEKVLGEGGMGTVWLARNVTLDAPVALKLIRPEADSAEAANRLLKEARAAAKIEHPAVIRVFDFGETEPGEPFIVMELLDGRSLADLLEERRTLPATTAIQMLLPIIDGLSHAHEQGVVHRDLKPSNIFLAHEGKRLQPKVVDFGIAKVDRCDPLPKLTHRGTILGSPSYMAPEQARGLEDVDPRADIWTVCVVLYEAITGYAAFHGANYNAILRSVIEDDVIPATDLGERDEALWRILARGLAKDRDDRWPSMRALGRALAQFLAERGVTEDVCGESLEEGWLPRSSSPGPDESHRDPSPSRADTPVLLVSRKASSRPWFQDASQASSVGKATLELSAGQLISSRARTRPHLPLAVAVIAVITFFSPTFVAVRDAAKATTNAPAIHHAERIEVPKGRTDVPATNAGAVLVAPDRTAVVSRAPQTQKPATKTARDPNARTTLHSAKVNQRAKVDRQVPPSNELGTIAGPTPDNPY